MTELIQITADAQGTSVVSARELYEFLEVKSRFNDWIRNRITKYNFRQDVDFVEVDAEGDFTKNLVKPRQGDKRGRPEVDYALSLNMAKELAMVEGNAKGKQARLYFIEKEEQLRQVLTSPAATEQVLIQLMSQSNQLLAAQQQLLASLRSDVDQLKSAQDGPKPRPTGSVRSASRQTISSRHGEARPASPRQPPVGEQRELFNGPFPDLLSGQVRAERRPMVSLRQTLHQLVVDYSAYQGAPMSQTYGYLYKRLFEVHGLSVHRLNRQPTESLLDVLERYRQLDNLYSLALNELIYPHE